MAKVLVIELADDYDLADALHRIRGVLEHSGSRIHAAIKEDADQVLAVFKETA